MQQRFHLYVRRTRDGRYTMGVLTHPHYTVYGEKLKVCRDELKEVLARELGVSKGSFYWHFKDRAALLSAVLAMWEDKGTEAVILGVEQEAERPEDRLWALMRRVFGTSLPFDNFEAQLRAWAQKDEQAAAVVARVDKKRRRYVTDQLVAAGLPRPQARHRAELLYRLLVGDFVMRSYGQRPLPRSALEQFHAWLLDGREGS